MRLSALLCPLLVYGWLGSPRLGVAGSAVANLSGQWLAALLFGRSLLAEGAPLKGTYPASEETDRRFREWREEMRRAGRPILSS